MGLFDMFRPAPPQKMTSQQALMVVVLAAVKCDGHVADEEVARLLAMCKLSPWFASNTGEQDRAIISFADNVLAQQGDAAVRKAVECLTLPLRETAFAYATDMVVGDGVVGPTEEAFMSGLKAQMGIPDSLAQAIVMVTMIRNRAVA